MGGRGGGRETRESLLCPLGAGVDVVVLPVDGSVSIESEYSKPMPGNKQHNNQAAVSKNIHAHIFDNHRLILRREIRNISNDLKNSVFIT